MKNFKKIGIMLTGLVIILMPVLVLAVGEGPSGDSIDPFNKATIETIVANVAKFVGKIGITVAAFFIIYSGFLFLTAQGSEAAIKKAKDTFLWAVVGAGILLGAWVIAEIVKNTIVGLGA